MYVIVNGTEYICTEFEEREHCKYLYPFNPQPTSNLPVDIVLKINV
jgi:hypothetical protein